MEIIKFEKVSLIINKGTPLEKTILNDVSFDIKENTITSIVGSSNSGKTAIAELVDALIRPSKGIIRIKEFYNDGKIIKNVNMLRKSIGYVFKNPYDMFFCKTVFDEIAFGAYSFKYKKDDLDKRVRDALKMVGLDEKYLKAFPLGLSLNNAKKVALASIIIYNPEIIILDEITIGLRKEEIDSIIRLIKLLKDKYKKTIILLTKNTDFAYSLSDEIILMNLTKLVKSGEVNILKNEELLDECNLNVPKIVDIIKVVRDKKNIKLEDYKDIKDLIKGVYRNVF